MSDLQFEGLLSEYNKNYKDAEEFSDWMPPDAEYIIVLQAPKKGVSEKKTPPMMWWKLTGIIEEPQNEAVHGKEFQVGFYNSNAFGILKSAARALNKGEPVSSLPEADKIFSAVEGTVAKVAVSTTEKDGKVYRNCYINDVLSVTDAEPEAEAPA